MLFLLEAGKVLSLMNKEDKEEIEGLEGSGEAEGAASGAVDEAARAASGASSGGDGGGRRLRRRVSWCQLLTGVFKRLLVQPVVVSIILGLVCNLVFNVMLDQSVPGLLLQVTSQELPTCIIHNASSHPTPTQPNPTSPPLDFGDRGHSRGCVPSVLVAPSWYGVGRKDGGADSREG